MNATRKFHTVRSAHKSVEEASPEVIAAKYRGRCYRSGKTERDHKNGTPKRRHDRRMARNEWYASTRGKVYTSREQVPAFPV